QRLLELRALHREHGAQLGRRNLLLQERPDLLQRKTELLQRQDAVQPRQLPDAVIAVAGLRIDAGRLQQTELVVEPQLPPRDTGDLGKFADAKHFWRSPHWLRFRGARYAGLTLRQSQAGFFTP